MKVDPEKLNTILKARLEKLQKSELVDVACRLKNRVIQGDRELAEEQEHVCAANERIRELNGRLRESQQFMQIAAELAEERRKIIQRLENEAMSVPF